MRFFRTAISGLAMLWTFAPATYAQDAFDAPPPHLSVIDGTVTFDREAVTEPAAPGAPLVPGDRVHTARGRVELLFPDGSALDVDEFSSFELQGPTLIRVTSGRVLLVVAGANDPRSAVRFQIDTPIASAQTDGPGEYRIALLSDPAGLATELAVVRGMGALVTERGTMPLRAGERSVAWDNAAPSAPQSFNSARFDAFDQWALARRDERLGSRSAQYLPPDLRVYGGSLDRYGAWQYDSQYGNVWYPTVGPDWRPYYDGYWSAVPTYGWTWIGLDIWSWPTHHYGRWGYGGSRWFWIPDRRWAPAWVSWGGAPGYVSWCPLGFDNRPVFALSVSTRNTWAGWTVLSRDHFGGRRNVHQYAVSPRALPVNTPFIVQNTAPIAPPHAVARRGGGQAQPLSGDARRSSIEGRPLPVEGQRRTGDGRQPTAVPRQPGLRDRQAPLANPAGQAPAASQFPQAGVRQPQAVGRQPQAISRQPQVDPSPPAQPSDRPAYDGRDRGVFRAPLPDSVRGRAPTPPDGVIYTNRSRIDGSSRSAPTPPQTTVPAVPPTPERPGYGIATRRPYSGGVPSLPPAAQDSRPAVTYGRTPGVAAPRYAPREATPPAAAPPPPPAPSQRQERAAPPQREERAAPPPERDGGQQARPRGPGRQSSAPASPPPEQQQGQGGGGRASRRGR
jgi:uncharacterized protein DUF6600/FecR-like protein